MITGAPSSGSIDMAGFLALMSNPDMMRAEFEKLQSAKDAAERAIALVGPAEEIEGLNAAARAANEAAQEAKRIAKEVASKIVEDAKAEAAQIVAAAKKDAESVLDHAKEETAIANARSVAAEEKANEAQRREDMAAKIMADTIERTDEAKRLAASLELRGKDLAAYGRRLQSVIDAMAEVLGDSPVK